MNLKNDVTKGYEKDWSHLRRALNLYPAMNGIYKPAGGGGCPPSISLLEVIL